MIGQGIQEKTGTPARCAHRRGKTQAVTAKCSRTPAHFTTKKGGVFPFRRELFTFSTGFSTDFVKKRPSFPRGFPLFPPGFPHGNLVLLIQAVMSPGDSCQFLGRFGPSPDWKKEVLSFPQNGNAAFSCGKSGENCGFPPSAAVLRQRVLYMPFLLRNASGIARLLVFRPALCPVKKLPPSRFTP